MRHFFCIVLLSLVSFGLFGQTMEWQWAQGTGAFNSNLDDEGFGIAIDNQGNQYVTGYFQYSAYFGSQLLTSAGNHDIFVVKRDPNGNYVWARRAGGPDVDRGHDIAVDSAGNVYITGAFEVTASFGSTNLTSSGSSWDPFVAKLDANGNWLWAVKGGGSGTDEAGYGIAVDSSSNVYVTGRFKDGSTFGAISLNAYGTSTYFDIFVAKLNSSGSWLWATHAGATSHDLGREIALDSIGNVYVTGYFDGTATFGTISIPSNNSTRDVFVAKLNNSGTWLWAAQAGTNTDSDLGYDIAVDSSTNIYVTGCYDGTATFSNATFSLVSVNSSIDIFVAKLNSSGTWLWAASAGGSDEDQGYGIAVDIASNVYITGSFDATASFGGTTLYSTSQTFDPFIAKLNSSGSWQWAVKGGGSGSNEYGDAIAVDSSYNIYLTGGCKDGATFGDFQVDTYGGDYFDIFFAKYGYTPPAAPSNLALSNVLSDQITLTWTDNTTVETGYCVERRLGTTGTWSQIETLAANATSYISTGLSQHTLYYYRVRAVNTSVYSLYSNVVNSTTLYSTPPAPTNLSASPVSSSQINLLWTDNSTVETGFLIDRKTGVSGSWGQIATVVANSTSYEDTGLVQHTTYYYRVRAVNTDVFSAYSNEAGATTPYTMPEAPSNLTADPLSYNQIHVSWTDNSTLETNFKLERKTGQSGNWALKATLAANVTTYIDSGLSEHTTYFYRVRALNVNVYSPYSNEDDATTLHAMPVAPGNLIAEVISSSQIDLSWNDNSSNEAGFELERKLGESGEWFSIASVSTNTTFYSDGGLSPNTAYFYRIRAYNDYGDSDYAYSSGVSTLLSPPANVGVMSIASNLFITWDIVTGAQSYFVYRSLDPYTANWGTHVAHTASPVYVEPITTTRSFYRIIASSLPLAKKSEDPFLTIPEDIRYLLNK